MRDDASPGAAAASTGQRKRKAKEPPGGGDKPPNSARKRPGESSSVDHTAILRGAIEFRDRTGLAPTKANLAAFFESVKGSLPVPLSQDQVFNRLRHLRHKFNHSDAHNDADPVLKLAAQLWPEEDVKKGKQEGKGPKKEKTLNSVALEEDVNGEKGRKEEKSPKKEKKHNSIALEEDTNAEKEDDEKVREGVDTKLKKKHDLVALAGEDEEIKDKNAEEAGIEPESFPYLTHNVAEHWKAYGLPKATLEIGMKLINATKAKVLEEKWKRLLEDEMRFQMEWAKTSRELFAMMLETHKGMS